MFNNKDIPESDFEFVDAAVKQLHALPSKIPGAKLTIRGLGTYELG
jgi:hypothetical protein